MKPFVKLQCDIVDRFETQQELLLFIHLLCLMDRDGRVRMSYQTLASKIGWKQESIEDVMQALMKRDPESTCKKYDGACVAFIDPNKTHLGFIIPAAVSHRKSNAINQKRLQNKARWMRDRRAELNQKGLSSRGRPLRGHCEDMRGQREDMRGLPLPSKNEVRGHCEDTARTNVDCDRDRDRDIKEGAGVAKGDITKTPTPSKTPEEPGLIHNVDQILALICEKVYDNRLRPNQIGRETVGLVAEMIPFSAEQIELVADYLTLPADDCWPELKKRRCLGFDQLIRYWADVVSQAVMFDQKYFAR